MNLHVTLNLNGVISTLDYPNAIGAFTTSTVNGFLQLFIVTRDNKTIAQWQAPNVIGWDNSNPAA